MRSKEFYLIPFFILVLTFLAYLPSLKNQFTNWDDPLYVLNNSMIRNFSIENIGRIFSEYCVGNYHPLTMLSLSFDYAIGNLGPESYHRTNLILHLANTFLVFIFIYLLFQKMGMATIVSVLFGVHTIHVESVAWVSERKDVLYTFFFLFSLILYLRYVKEDKAKFYWFSLILFFLSILSKGMAVSFTISLIAIDFFLGRRLIDKKVMLEKIPFLILSIIFGIVAIIAQNLDPKVEDVSHHNIIFRIIFACYGFVNYMIKLILPIDLSTFYPYPDQHDLPFVFWLCPFIALGITGLIVYSLKKRKDIFFGFTFFLINVFLVLQLLPVGRAIMADRYTYIPSIGFFIMVAGTYKLLIQKNTALKPILIGVLAAYTIFLSTLTYKHSKVWRDSLTLWTYTIKDHPSDIAYYNLGDAYDNLGKYQTAIENYNKAIALNPLYAMAYNNRGVAQIGFKKYDASMLDFSKAISIDPNCAGAYYNRGNLWSNFNKMEKAIADFTKALTIDTSYADAYVHRANTWNHLNKPEKAVADYDKALSLDPFHPEVLNNRGLSKRILRDDTGAMLDFNKAISIDPANADAYYNRGNVWIDLSDPEKALSDFNKVLSVVPSHSGAFAGALISRGLIKRRLKDYEGAMKDFDKAISIDSAYADAYYNRGNLWIDLNNLKKALADFDKVLSIDTLDAKTLNNRGLTKMILKEYDGSMKDFNKAISIDSLYIRAYANRAQLKYNLKDSLGGNQDKEKIRSIQSGSINH
jgi:protein O-mannosyl-transferase